MKQTFNVYLYREMCLKFPYVEAENAEQAAAMCCELPTDDAEFVEDCEGDNTGAIVDVGGDTEYEHTVMLDLRDPNSHALTKSALATILAALRVYQCHLEGHRIEDVTDIATHGGSIEAMDCIEIDHLCEKLNT